MFKSEPLRLPAAGNAQKAVLSIELYRTHPIQDFKKRILSVNIPLPLAKGRTAGFIIFSLQVTFTGK
jgi:hypothetical protein